MQGIKLVLSYTPDLIVKTPTVFTNYIINNDTEGNKSGATVLNSTTLGIYLTHSMQKKCTGKHFNRQSTHEILNK